jgi:hypothetical protein
LSERAAQIARDSARNTSSAINEVEIAAELRKMEKAMGKPITGALRESIIKELEEKYLD